MALILFDTNIFIDMLNGVHEATVELAATGIVSNVSAPFVAPAPAGSVPLTRIR